MAKERGEIERERKTEEKSPSVLVPLFRAQDVSERHGGTVVLIRNPRRVIRSTGPR